MKSSLLHGASGVVVVVVIVRVRRHNPGSSSVFYVFISETKGYEEFRYVRLVSTLGGMPMVLLASRRFPRTNTTSVGALLELSVNFVCRARMVNYCVSGKSQVLQRINQS